MLAATGIFFEDSRRWPEISMNLFPRLVEAFKNNFIKLKYPIGFKYGPHILFAFAIGAINYIYQKNVSSPNVTFLASRCEKIYQIFP